MCICNAFSLSLSLSLSMGCTCARFKKTSSVNRDTQKLLESSMSRQDNTSHRFLFANFHSFLYLSLERERKYSGGNCSAIPSF